MDIVVKGRNVEVPEHYRVLVAEKVGRLGRYDRKLLQFDVELFHEPKVTGGCDPARFVVTRDLNP